MSPAGMPALLAAFSMGPVSGVAVCLIKNLVNLFSSTTNGVGELCNFLLGVCLVVPAGLIYTYLCSKGESGLYTRKASAVSNRAFSRVKGALKITRRPESPLYW